MPPCLTACPNQEYSAWSDFLDNSPQMLKSIPQETVSPPDSQQVVSSAAADKLLQSAIGPVYHADTVLALLERGASATAHCTSNCIGGAAVLPIHVLCAMGDTASLRMLLRPSLQVVAEWLLSSVPFPSAPFPSVSA